MVPHFHSHCHAKLLKPSSKVHSEWNSVPHSSQRTSEREEKRENANIASFEKVFIQQLVLASRMKCLARNIKSMRKVKGAHATTTTPLPAMKATQIECFEREQQEETRNDRFMLVSVHHISTNEIITIFVMKRAGRYNGAHT
jgi:Zn-dependent M16 (insulinase) family peptidase